MKHILLLAILAIFGLPAPLRAQVAVKTNILYDATTTPNLGIEVGVAGKSTFNIVYGLNPWSFGSATRDRKFARHWILMPEYRWWPCTRFTGHFAGVHLMTGELNACNVSLPLPGGFVGGTNLSKAAGDARVQGPFAGIGMTYGYQWALSRHWNVEAEIGAGYAHVWYAKFPCGSCGQKIEEGNADYLGLTKVGISLMYIF